MSNTPAAAGGPVCCIDRLNPQSKADNRVRRPVRARHPPREVASSAAQLGWNLSPRALSSGSQWLAVSQEMPKATRPICELSAEELARYGTEDADPAWSQTLPTR
jgi:hypothetical protein